MRKEDVAKFKKSCEVAKSRNDDDKTSLVTMRYVSLPFNSIFSFYFLYNIFYIIF